MIELLYYIGEILQEVWWLVLLMGVLAALFMQFAPKEEEWECLDDYYNPNPFINNPEVDPVDGSKPDLKQDKYEK